MVLSRAQLAAMPRRTPTQIAEEAYQASRGTRRYADTVGPAGIPIPDPRTGWRATSDGKLLQRIIYAAFVDYRASIITPEREAAMADILAEALAVAFPPSDMMVLRRYDLAAVRGRIAVELGRAGFKMVELPEPILLPNGKGSFHTGSGSGLPLPAAAMPFFDDTVAIDDLKTPEFMNAQHWPGQVKSREQRWPFWREIEAAWPRIGAWMSAQRVSA